MQQKHYLGSSYPQSIQSSPYFFQIIVSRDDAAGKPLDAGYADWGVGWARTCCDRWETLHHAVFVLMKNTLLHGATLYCGLTET
jgi:hypothetical protein